MADLRIRFDDTFNDVINELRERSVLVSLSQIALFSGAFGYSIGEKLTRSRGNLDVRLSVLENSTGAKELMDAIAFIEAPQNRDSISAEAGEEAKVAKFEEYVNGGLEALKRIMDSGKSLPTEINFLMNQKLQEFQNQMGQEILPDFN